MEHKKIKQAILEGTIQQDKDPEVSGSNSSLPPGLILDQTRFQEVLKTIESIWIEQEQESQVIDLTGAASDDASEGDVATDKAVDEEANDEWSRQHSMTHQPCQRCIKDGISRELAPLVKKFTSCTNCIKKQQAKVGPSCKQHQKHRCRAGLGLRC